MNGMRPPDVPAPPPCSADEAAPQGTLGLLFRTVLAWLFILCLAMANGALREAALIPWLGQRPGLVLSGVLLSLCVAAVAAILVRKCGAMTARQALQAGALWLLMTLAFEFGFGLLVRHKSWPELLAAYTFEDGNLWPLVLLVTLLAPWGAVRYQTRSRHPGRGA